MAAQSTVLQFRGVCLQLEDLRDEEEFALAALDQLDRLSIQSDEKDGVYQATLELSLDCPPRELVYAPTPQPQSAPEPEKPHGPDPVHCLLELRAELLSRCRSSLRPCRGMAPPVRRALVALLLRRAALLIALGEPALARKDYERVRGLVERAASAPLHAA